MSTTDALLPMSDATSKKRSRKSTDSPNKSPKLAEGSTPGEKLTKYQIAESDSSSLKFPFTIFTEKKKPSSRRSGYDDEEELDFCGTSVCIKFKMSADDIELKLHGGMRKEDDSDDEEFVDPEHRDDGERDPDVNKFTFIHFDQFSVVESNKPDDGSEDDGDDGDSSTYPEEKEKDPVLKQKFMDVRVAHDLEMKKVMASSSNLREDAWLRENGVKKRMMFLGTKKSLIRSITASVSAALKFKVQFSSQVTKHMSICGLEQVLRQPAPPSLVSMLRSVLRYEKANCAEMVLRYNHIFSDDAHADILIGDLIPFDNDFQSNISILSKFRDGRGGNFVVKVERCDLEDPVTSDSESDSSSSGSSSCCSE